MTPIGLSEVFPHYRNFHLFEIVDKISVPKVALVFASILGFGYLQYRKNALKTLPPSLPFTELLTYCAEPFSEHLSLQAMGRLSQTCTKINEVFKAKTLRRKVFICEILDRICTLIPTVKFNEEWYGGWELFQSLAKYHPALATHLVIQIKEPFGNQNILRRLAKTILLTHPSNAEILLEKLFDCAQGVNQHAGKIQTFVQIAEAFAPLNAQRANQVFEAAMQIAKRAPYCTFRNEFLLIIQRQASVFPDQPPVLVQKAYELARQCENPCHRSILFSGLAASLTDPDEAKALFLASLDILIPLPEHYLIARSILKFLKYWDRKESTMILSKLRILLTKIKHPGSELGYLPKIATLLSSFDPEVADILFTRSLENIDLISKETSGQVKTHIRFSRYLRPFAPEKADALLRKALDSVEQKTGISYDRVQNYCKIAGALFPLDPQKALEIFEKQIAFFEKNMQEESSFYDMVDELCLIDDDRMHPLLYQIFELGHRLKSYKSLVYRTFQTRIRKQFWEDIPFILQETQKKQRTWLMLKPVYPPENQISFLLRSLEVLDPDTDTVHAKLDRLLRHQHT